MMTLRVETEENQKIERMIIRIDVPASIWPSILATAERIKAGCIRGGQPVKDENPLALIGPVLHVAMDEFADRLDKQFPIETKE